MDKLDLVKLDEFLSLCKSHGIVVCKINGMEFIFDGAGPETNTNPNVESTQGIPSDYDAVFGGNAPEFTKVNER